MHVRLLFSKFSRRCSHLLTRLHTVSSSLPHFFSLCCRHRLLQLHDKGPLRARHALKAAEQPWRIQRGGSVTSGFTVLHHVAAAQLKHAAQPRQHSFQR